MLESTIVAGNSQASTTNVGPDIWSTRVTSYKNSAIGNAQGISNKSDQGGNLPFGANLLLGPLTNNGGLSPTIMPLFGSPVINQGSNPANLTTDERGVVREWQSTCQQLVHRRASHAALSHDALDHFFPLDIRTKWGLTLPRP